MRRTRPICGIRPLVAAMVFSAASLISMACDPSASDDPEIKIGMSRSDLRHELEDRFGFRPLSREPVPQPIGGHILDNDAAIRLGKAFFWDTQVGSDGRVACATCHQTAGADARVVNTIDPGFDEIFDAGGVTGPGQTFTHSRITSDDVVGSQGVARGVFVSINPDPAVAEEECTAIDDPLFHFERRIDPRQAPAIFGAAFMRELFWGGEAHHQFNGITIWGPTPNNRFSCPPQVACTVVENGGLISQASGPIGNSTEMRCTGRVLNGPIGLGSKMLARQPLQHQQISATDSVLGALANPNGSGLMCNGAPCNYRDMISDAFGAAIAADAENFFSLAWAESVAAYERTLIPDHTRFDDFLDGDLSALSFREFWGLVTFVGRGKCTTCHAGPMMSDATVRFFDEHGALNRDGGDQGFHNIGLFNSFQDGGRGTLGPGDFPITVSLSMFDDFAFKTPHLRNIGLTAPYFHTGVYPTLEEVVDFYDRGGDFANEQRSADIQPLHLGREEKRVLVEFMRNALTDCRVVQQQAPFDHPELDVPNGPHLPAVGAEGVGSCP